jgi:hypothetical protein
MAASRRRQAVAITASTQQVAAHQVLCTPLQALDPMLLPMTLEDAGRQFLPAAAQKWGFQFDPVLLVC